MAINRFVDTDLVIEDLLQETGMDSQVYLPTFRRWIKKAYGYMNDCHKGLDSWIQVHTVENCGFAVPKNATVLDVMMVGDLGCECSALIENVVLNLASPYGLTVDSSKPLETQLCMSAIDYTIENDRVKFLKNKLDGETFTIRWYGYKTNCEGKFMINELAVNACIAYCEHMLAKRSIFKGKEYRLSEGMIVKLQKDWQWKLAQARGDLIQATSEEYRQMGDMLNTVVPSYTAGYGYDLTGSFNNW